MDTQPEPTRDGLPAGGLRTNCGTCRSLFPREPQLWVGNHASGNLCPNSAFRQQRNPPVDPGNVPPPNADGQRTFNDPALGFRGLERHRLDSRSKGTQAAGREAWWHLDAGTDDAIRRYEHTW